MNGVAVAERKKKTRKFTSPALAGADAVNAIRIGLPFAELEKLRAHLDVSQEQAASYFGISPATFHRRKNEGALDPAESDRLIRYLRIWTKALEVFENADNARA